MSQSVCPTGCPLGADWELRDTEPLNHPPVAPVVSRIQITILSCTQVEAHIVLSSFACHSCDMFDF